MGLNYVATKITELSKNGKAYEGQFRVDSGAIVCMAPTDQLQAVGIQPEGKEAYELANGQPVEYEFGFARVSFNGYETVCKVIFGPPKSEPLLGVTALESVGMVLDPVSKTLRKLPAMPLKCLLSGES
jgi:clan AA aspartic protease